jgi:putative ABC transport system ATP-binding protein
MESRLFGCGRGDAMILLKDVCKQFQLGSERVDALLHVSLEIKQGECVVIKGASGSGKSTLLSLIAGLAQPSSGEVRALEKEVSKLPEHLSALFRRTHIGFIFQRYHLISSLNVEENIIAPLIPKNLPLSELSKRAKEVMEPLGLLDKAKRSIKQLSGGEQQRVAIARALINQPSVILADEPTANLDEALSQELLTHLEALKQSGVTLLIATHDPLFFDLAFVDRIVELKNGRLLS